MEHQRAMQSLGTPEHRGSTYEHQQAVNNLLHFDELQWAELIITYV
jgi:hypothetical protein